MQSDRIVAGRFEDMIDQFNIGILVGVKEFMSRYKL
jgi:hypothetical protein